MTRGFQLELGHLANRAASAAKSEQIEALVRAFSRLDAQTTQGAVLGTLLTEVRQFASRAAFFLTRPEGVRCWSSEGFEPSAAQALDGQQVEYGAGHAWGALAEGKGVIVLDSDGCRALTDRIDAASATSGVLVPFVLRGQVGGALYADQTEGGRALNVGALQLLTHATAQALETLSIRGGVGSPSLRFADGVSQAAPLWSDHEAPSTPEEPTVEEAAPVAEEPMVESAPTTEPSSVEAPSTESSSVESVASAAAGAIAAGVGAAVGAVAAGAGAVAEAFRPDESDAEYEDADQASEETTADIPVADLADESMTVDEPQTDWTVSEASPSDTVDLLETPDFDTAATPIYGSAPAADTTAAEPAASPDFTVPDIASPEVVTAPEISVPDVSAPDFEVPGVAAPEFETPDIDVSEDGPSDFFVSDPEPETEDQEDLDDTASALWDLEEEDEDVTAVTAPPRLSEPEPPALEAPPILSATDHAPVQEHASDPAAGFPHASPDQLVGQQTVRLDVSALQQASPPAQSEPTLDTQQAPAAAWQQQTSAPPAAASGAHQASPGDSEDPTIMVSRDQILPSPPPQQEPADPPMGVGFGSPPSTQVGPPAKPAPAGGSSEVVPPDDIYGPGSAFGASSHVPEGEQALHEEARRLARLLVSEIKLYNEDQIAAGRRDHNIYERLKDDIDRSRQMYEDRIHERIRNSEDYFYLELVQRLADGNAEVLGI